MTSKPDIVRRMFAAYRDQDRKTAESLLADDFTFTSPYDDAIDRATYFERCWPTSDRIKSQVIEAIGEVGGRVFVLYKCTTDEGKEFHNTEVFTFAGDRIRSTDVYFGAAYRDGRFVKA